MENEEVNVTPETSEVVSEIVEKKEEITPENVESVKEPSVGVQEETIE